MRTAFFLFILALSIVLTLPYSAYVHAQISADRNSTPTQDRQLPDAGLVEMNAQGSPAPSLAEKWTVDTQHRWIDFKLDSRARWSDGSAITADDVFDSFESPRKVRSQTPAAHKLYEGIGVVDQNTIRFILNPGVTAEQFLLRLTHTSNNLVKPAPIGSLARTEAKAKLARGR